MRVRRSLAALLAAPALLLAACGGGSSVADPPASSGPTSSPPTSQPPAHESPQHFIRRWADAEKQMENTGKTGPYLAMSRDCRACRQLAADIHGFYAAGGYASWGGWKILSVARDGPHGLSEVYDVKVDSAPTTYRDSSSTPIKHLPGGVTTHQLTIRSVGDSWHVTQKAQLSQ